MIGRRQATRLAHGGGGIRSRSAAPGAMAKAIRVGAMCAMGMTTSTQPVASSVPDDTGYGRLGLLRQAEVFGYQGLSALSGGNGCCSRREDQRPRICGMEALLKWIVAPVD